MKYSFSLLILTIFLVSSDETDGSILEVFETEELTSAELEELANNIEPTDDLATEAEVDLIDTSDSENDADFGLFNQLSEQSQVTSHLTFQNSILTETFNQLETQLLDSTEKINSYRYDYEITSDELIEKIDTLDGYNHQIIRDYLKSIDGENDSEGDDDSDEISQTTIVGVCVGIVFLLLFGVKTICASGIYEVFNKALYGVFEGITILMVIMAGTCLAYYVDPFEDIEYEYLMAGLALFTFVWLFFGVFSIVMAQGFVHRWVKLEKTLKSTEKTLAAYDYVPKTLENPVRYYVMKKLFTDSPCLPNNLNLQSINFSMYLSKSLANTLKELFQITWLGYILVLASVVSWRILIYSELSLETEILLAFPIFSFLIILIFLIKLVYIYNQLVPQISEELLQKIDPFDLSTLPRPNYLNGRIPSFESNPSFCLCINTHPLKLTIGYLFNGQVPNRQESLFWLDVYGIKFIKGIIQGLTISLCLWATIEILYYLPESNNELFTYISITVSFLLWLITLFLIIPSTLKYLSIVSSIEMKKDKNTIQECLVAEKISKNQLMMRIYRQMKMIYRDKFLENKHQALSEFMEKFTEEIFCLHSSETLSINDLEDVLGLCGIELNDDELRLFAKECAPVKAI